MLANMSERTDTPAANWSELGVSELPTGTVTLLLADVEGSTRLWETQAEQMTAAIARLDHTLAEVLAAHDGVRPVEQGEGDSFVAAFARASDAVACALALQRAPLAPIRLRIGLHSGEVQLRDEGNYIGPTINRTARIRDLGHGGQTVLSAITEALVIDRLPDGAWLIELGSYPLRGLPRPERVLQLCHPDLSNDFPPLRASTAVASTHLPPQLTSFIGRGAQIDDVRALLGEGRLVTLTGSGGAGKTRLAVQIAGLLADQFADGICYVDLAPITDPELVPMIAARALGLPDQPDRSAMDTLIRWVGERHLLMVLDNCEHLLDASAALLLGLLGACPQVTFLATSREPIAVDGEVVWRVPSLSLADESIALFTDRARHARPDFQITDDNAAAIAEICRRLDGMPLAIELAAARVRALSLEEILEGLHDRFRLLTGGSRRAVRRQQTLHASVDWSHALLTDPERVLFRRLAAFMDGFRLDAAQAVAGCGAIASHQVLDQLTLLVDKSLVIAENAGGRTRYRMLEMVRQYAMEKLGESGEADAIRARHRDHYTAMAAALDNPPHDGHEMMLARADAEIDNLRAAFAWSQENDEPEHALTLASSLLPLWLGHGRIAEGVAWFDAALRDSASRGIELARAVRARALADHALLNAWGLALNSLDEAQEAVAIARDLDDPALLARALTACVSIAAYKAEVAAPYFAEAIELARALDDRWRLSQILGWQTYAAAVTGDLNGAFAIGQQGRDLADSIGDQFNSRYCRNWQGMASYMQGDLAGEIARCREMIVEADGAADLLNRFLGLQNMALALAFRREVGQADEVLAALIETGSELSGVHEGVAYMAVGLVALAGGDAAAAAHAHERMWHHIGVYDQIAAIFRWCRAETAVALGDLAAAARWAEDGVAATTGWYRMMSLVSGARVAIAQGEPERAERDLYEALTIAAGIKAQTGVPEIFECLGATATRAASPQEAARLFGAAHGIRARTGNVRLKIHDADWHAWLTALRESMDDNDFDSAWAEGAALSTADAIGYALRGRGERKRPANGWGSLTPTELDVARLVSEGLSNKDIAARLFVSPRTVQTHLTHVYTKLGLTSRVQLAQEVARRA
ncbi:LuxR family transcriptional regulator [Mycolicibacter virginiensis]|uniref:LuxR family transcriptional regulator n=2 Tax=Mycolicibacter virginiensis TaxID=1795032 RepID=A0A9X7ILZ5_9MYCO|nr:LuxR family transcriptional regulator [Mycolicibacter virginiensis]PQM51672.1 LuxR family transcriptional regulator [Mycolicibacter virginiensis]